MYRNQNNGGVEFQEVEFKHSRAGNSSSRGGLTKKLIRSGIAKDEQQATYVLIGVVVVIILTAWWIWPSGPAVNEQPTYNPPAEDPNYNYQ